MNKQELLKQADYTFQRGNRALAKKYLLDMLAEHPGDEAAWMLLARVHQDKDHKMECYERVLKINANNHEAKIGLIRVRSISPTLPLHSIVEENPWQVVNPVRNILRGVIVVLALLLGLGTTTFVIAKNNPESAVARLILAPTPTAFAQPLADDIAVQTRAQVSSKYPQYASLLDALIGLAIKNADGGMDGAPERPGAEIVIFEGAAQEARSKLETALPQPGSLSAVTLNEQQVTSWLALELDRNPDLPITDIQVYLRDDRIQIWSMVSGSTNATSALIVGALKIDSDGQPAIEVESMQVGQQTIPDILVSQGESWLNQLITEKIGSQVPGLEIMNINIGNGLITISGMR